MQDKIEEYQRKQFGFTSREFVEDLEEAHTEAVKKMLTKMEASVAEDSDITSKGGDYFAKLREMYMEQIRVTYEKLGVEMLDIMKVRNMTDDEKTVTILNDSGKSYTDQDVLELEKEIEKLEDEYLREKQFDIILKEKTLEFEDKVLPLFKKAVSLLPIYKEMLKKLETNQVLVGKMEDNIMKFLQYYNKQNLEGLQASLDLQIFKNS